jgi:shikimate 5-dehydrogenase
LNRCAARKTGSEDHEGNHRNHPHLPGHRLAGGAGEGTDAVQCLFQAHDLDARVIPFKIEPERYCEAVRMFMKTENVGGIFVSIPHKPMTLEAVEQATLRARVAGACNAVYRDAEGVIRAT